MNSPGWGTPYNGLYRGALPKGAPFSGFRVVYERAGNSLVEVSIYMSNQSVKGLKRLTDASWTS